jgi:hypothetical protein
MNAWGVYLIASVALVAAFTPRLIGTTQDSREGIDYRMADGISSLLDSLRPGIVLTFSFGAWSTADSAHLSGHLVSLQDGNLTVTMRTRFSLPNATLSPGVQYRAWLEGGSVRVSELG